VTNVSETWRVGGLVLILAVSGRGDDRAEVQALTARALRAAGGTERLAGIRSVAYEAQVTARGPDPAVQVRKVTVTLGPGGTYRRDTMIAGDAPIPQRRALAEGGGWSDDDGYVRDLPPEACDELAVERELDRLCLTLDPLRDPALVPSKGDGATIDGRPSSVLWFDHPILGAVRLDFDDETARLVRVAVSQPVPGEFTLSDHREVPGSGGVTVAWRRSSRGSTTTFLTLALGTEPPDPSLFARPEGRGPDAPAPALDPSRAARLAKLARVWGRARYLHPTLASGAFDWDTPLVQALPLAAAARDDVALGDAVAVMLAAVGDPATRVVRDRPVAVAMPARKAALVERRADGLVVLTPDPAQGGADLSGAERRGEIRAAVTAARGVIVDLRGLRIGNGLPSEFFDQFFAALPPRAVPGLASRAVVHSGYRPHSGRTSGGYDSYFVTRMVPAYQPVVPAAARRTAFLVGPESSVPPIALALQAAGDGVIVAQGGLAPDIGIPSIDIRLGEGLLARIRTADLIGPDGRLVQPRADVEVAADADPGPDGPAFRAAIDRLQTPAPASAIAPESARGEAQPLPPAWTWTPDRPYLAMPYPRLEYRLLALFRAWTVIDLFFPYKDLIGEDWDEVLVRSIPAFEAAANPREYALALAEFWAQIRDSHGTVASAELQGFRGQAPAALVLRSIEGRPVVTAVHGPATRGELRIGDVVTHVDGEPVEARLELLGRYTATSTPQDRAGRLATQLVFGPEGSTCHLTVVGGDDEPRQVEMPRSRANFSRVLESMNRGEAFRVLDDGIGYAHLGRLTNAQVDAMFEAFGSTRAIVFDLRNYPQGTAWSIAPRLNVRGAVHAASFRRNLVGGELGHEEGSASFAFLQPIPATDKPKYTGKVVVLIDERAMSQAEHTGLFFEAACKPTFIGSPTAGANGDVTRLVVPGGITLMFSGHDVRHVDGRQLQRVGLIPDIEARPTVAGIRAGRDEVLERALTYLGLAGAEAERIARAVR
jgi:C-terminal processing protease CtpA/Prc